jgi:hypothetical protein
MAAIQEFGVLGKNINFWGTTRLFPPLFGLVIILDELNNK